MAVASPGIYPDILIEEYVADPVDGGSLSSSELGVMLTCPAKLGYGKSSPALSFGSAAHHLILEGEAGFYDRYLVAQHDGRSKAGKEERQRADDHGLTVLRQQDFEAIKAMAAAIRAHPTAHDLLTSGPVEQTLIWQDADTGVWLRSRPDVLPKGAVTVDYKTVADASPRAMQKHIWEYGYARQAALVRDGRAAVEGVEAHTSLLVCQEKEPPYLVAVYEIGETAIEWGRTLNRWAIERYQRCTEAGVWPGYTEDVETLELPGWADSAIERIKATIQPTTPAAEQEQPDPEEVFTP